MRPVGELYKQIAIVLTEAIGHDDWAEAWVCAEILDDVGRFSGTYKDDSGKDVSVTIPTGKVLFPAFKEIRDQLRRPGEAPWKAAKFSLLPSGKFNIEFEYNDSTRWRTRK